MFQVYTGMDPVTGRSLNTTRRGFETRRAAEIALARLMVSIEDGTFQTTKQKTTSNIEELAKLWLPIYKTTVKIATYASTLKILENHVYPAFKSIQLQKLTVPVCQKIVNEWAEEKPKTFKKWKFYSSKLLDYAVSIEMIPDNPMKKTIMPKVEKEEKEIVFFNKDEVKQFLKFTYDFDPNRAFLFFRVLAYTGVRKGEAFALTWEDINFKDSTLTVNKTISRGINSELVVNRPKTKASIRTISLDPETLFHLKAWKSKQRVVLMQLGHPVKKKEQLIFNSQTNTHLNATRDRRWLDQIYLRTPKDFKRISSHGFRHTHASLLFEAGATIKEVQERLGHSDISTTMNIYTHVTESAKEKVANKFAEYMSL